MLVSLFVTDPPLQAVLAMVICTFVLVLDIRTSSYVNKQIHALQVRPAHHTPSTPLPRRSMPACSFVYRLACMHTQSGACNREDVSNLPQAGSDGVLASILVAGLVFYNPLSEGKVVGALEVGGFWPRGGRKVAGVAAAMPCHAVHIAARAQAAKADASRMLDHRARLDQQWVCVIVLMMEFGSAVVAVFVTFFNRIIIMWCAAALRTSLVSPRLHQPLARSHSGMAVNDGLSTLRSHALQAGAAAPRPPSRSQAHVQASPHRLQDGPAGQGLPPHVRGLRPALPLEVSLQRALTRRCPRHSSWTLLPASPAPCAASAAPAHLFHALLTPRISAAAGFRYEPTAAIVLPRPPAAGCAAAPRRSGTTGTGCA